MSSELRGTPIKIVVAEDDIDDQLLFTEALTYVKTRTYLVLVNNGEQLINLLKKAENDIPDIIFLDNNMPCVGGIECLVQIKENNYLDKIPCILISTSSHPVTIEKAFKEGANLYVIKPDSFENWVKIIEKVLLIKWDDYFPPKRESFVLGEDSL